MQISSLLMATHNSGKLREFRSLMSETGWEILGLADLAIDEDCAETGQSFIENASIKALHYSKLTGLPVLGDDSGLEVAALGGQPGIYSARYAGPGASDRDRIQKIVQEIRASGGNHQAQFVCALCLAQGGRVIVDAEGICSGEIIDEPRGSNGFGYDPIFLVPELGRTFAELTEAEKNLRSHRARAVRALLEKIGDSPKAPI